MALKVKQLSYGRTFNNGNYSSSHIEVTIALHPNEDPDEVFEELVEYVKDLRKKERRNGKK